ncbi:PP2C family protein-serine/threonine phosphatase [Pseudoalteromonas sp. SSDWG2]|uniref:PP2C family protein-serine/threonine phosphatase n=1 Tax=Pseudoalteromonas sp. SSDWG2 TaxID=3139391 RepID=UPI003BA95D4D
MKLISNGLSHQGFVRHTNEDALLELPEHKVWVIADGMGSHVHGDFASELIITEIKNQLSNGACHNNKLSAIRDALSNANERLYHYSVNQLKGQKVGSTAVVLVLTEDTYHYIWVGDSRGYLLRNNVLSQQTRDHSQVNELLDEGAITDAQATAHPLNSKVSRAIGVSANVIIDSVQGPLVHNDTFLLCSDGLTGQLSDVEIEHALIDSATNVNAQNLVQSVLDRGAQDNVSCILVKYAS